MSRSMRKDARNAKSAAFRIRKVGFQSRNQISPVMQKVKDLLPAGTAAKTLAYLLDEPLNACEKLLCGARAENAEILAKLLCLKEHDIGRQVLLAIGEGRNVDYIEEVRRRASLKAMKRNLDEATKLYAKALQAEIAG